EAQRGRPPGGPRVGAKQPPTDQGHVAEVRIPAAVRNDRQSSEEGGKDDRRRRDESRVWRGVAADPLPAGKHCARHYWVSAGADSAATAVGSNCGSTMAKLVFAGSARGIAIAPSSSSFTMRAMGTSGGESPPVPEVMMICPRLKRMPPTSSRRMSIVPALRPFAMTGM